MDSSLPTTHSFKIILALVKTSLISANFIVIFTNELIQGCRTLRGLYFSLTQDYLIENLLYALILEFCSTFAPFPVFPPGYLIPNESYDGYLYDNQHTSNPERANTSPSSESLLIKQSAVIENVERVFTLEPKRDTSSTGDVNNPTVSSPITFTCEPTTSSPLPDADATLICNKTSQPKQRIKVSFGPPSPPSRTRSLTATRPIFPITPPRTPTKFEINTQHISHERLFEATIPSRRKIITTPPPTPSSNSLTDLIELGVGPRVEIEFGLAHLGFEKFAREIPDAIAVVWRLLLTMI
jgi:hypothetical protein